MTDLTKLSAEELDALQRLAEGALASPPVSVNPATLLRLLEELKDNERELRALRVRRCGCGHYDDEHQLLRHKCDRCKCTGFVPSPMTMVFVEAQKKERAELAAALAQVREAEARWEALKEYLFIGGSEALSDVHTEMHRLEREALSPPPAREGSA